MRSPRIVKPLLRLIGLVILTIPAGTEAMAADTVGFSQLGHENGWRAAFSTNMQAVAKARGIILRFDDASGSAKAQIAAVRRFIAERVDAIIIAPLVVTGWTPVLEEARAAHIPVFIVNRSVDVDPSLFVTRVGNDTNLEGRLAAAWLAQATLGQCAVVELKGTEGAAPTIGRQTGFATVLAAFPEMQVIRSESGNFTREGGRRAMEDLLGATDHLKGICAVWSHNDDMLLGAIEAMKAAGLHPGRDITMVSVDGVPDIYRALLAGEANLSVKVDPDLGPIIFDTVEGYLHAGRVYPKWILVPIALHTRADAARMLQQTTPDAR